MSIRQTIMVLGFFIIIQPFLGFTSTIDTIINIIIGLIIIILAYRLLPLKQNNPVVKKTDLPFVEHKNSDVSNNIASQ